MENSVIFGAVAWLTSKPILESLVCAKERKATIMLVVQKEDFLKPQSLRGSRKKWATEIRRLYDLLGDVETSRLTEFLPSVSCDISLKKVKAVRCLGNFNADKNPSHPRMHNKFLVIGSKTVWSGSYNFSLAAEMSYENAVIMRDEKVAKMYMKEFALLFSLSEPLDWKSKTMQPELLTIGT